MPTDPAIVQGSERRAVAYFIEDTRGDLVEKIEHESGATIRIYQDLAAEMPRGQWMTTLGIIADWHRRGNIGDVDHGDRKVTDTELDALKRGGWPLLRRYLRRTEGATNVIPIGLLDHSGWHVYADGGSHWSDAAGWDSGTVGFIYTTPEKLAECGTPEDKIDEQLRAEIEELDQYFRGDVYGYVVTLGTEEIDSCWGFYGVEYAIEEAKNGLADLVERTRVEWAESFVEAQSA